MRTVYLDHNATTAVAPEVVETMLPYLTEHFGNPSSIHRMGTVAAKALRDARRAIAGFIGSAEGEIIFTSCGTESNNLAIRGVLEASPDKRHIVTTQVEHSCVMNVCKRMDELGYDVTYLPVDVDGQLSVDDFRKALRDDTAIVTVMHANNETGVIFPIKELGAICREREIPFHVDTVQVIGKIPFNVNEYNIDFMSMSGHKLHAPKGVGALFCRKDVVCDAFLRGGTQERGRRPGTENVAGIAALGRACELAEQKLPLYESHVRPLRDHFESEILKRISGVTVTGGNSPRMPNTANIRFAGTTSDVMLMKLDEVGICASGGSACKSGVMKPSHVQTAMGVPSDEAMSAIRFSLATETTREDIDYAIENIVSIVAGVRATSKTA